MAQNEKKIVLITGCSSGIGEATASLLTDKGFQVFGTSRHPNNQQRKFEMISLDVTDEDSIAGAIQAVLAKAGRIDILINNAGFGMTGGAEESSLQQAQKIFDTNVFGIMRMIKAILPIMRKQQGGRIINISSVLGKIPSPYMALYSATKHAVEGYSESLDHEIRKFNIRSILIEPAYTKTKFDLNSIEADQPSPLYDAERKQLKKMFETLIASADAPEVVAKTILTAATDQKPKLRYTAGKTALMVSLLRRFLPEAMFDSSLRKQMGLD
jgi:short-subunit dehydrogenase